MAQCHNCGAQAADGAATCPECGAALANQHGQQPAGQQAGGQPAGRADGGQAAAGYQQAPQNAPGKSKIVSAIFAFWGIVAIIGGIAFLAFADMMPGGFGFQQLGIALTLILFLIAAIELATAYGLWNVKQWGWYAGLILSVLSVLGNAASVAQGAVMLPGLFLLVALFSVWALWDERRVYSIDF